MFGRNVAAIALIAVTSTVMAFACECSNNVPIQSTSERYRQRAVFRAHVFHLVGRTEFWNGKRYGTVALAVVRKQYWGLPWYWPKIVVLSSAGACADIGFLKGEDYLVSGRRGRYGLLEVSGCSRTQPLNTAQLDLRTIDGSHCSGPGGTMLGYVYDPSRKYAPVPNMSVTLRDQNGATYATKTDNNGIYEMEHLPAGDYVLESRIATHQYETWRRGLTVVEGECRETAVFANSYDFSGLLAPGMSSYVALRLLTVGRQPKPVSTIPLEADGRFYFRDIADGEYLLSASIGEGGPGRELYYPGTSDVRKATRIKVKNHKLVSPSSLTFQAEVLSLVPIRIALDSPINSRFSWRVQLISLNYIAAEARWSAGDHYVSLFGKRGWPYGIGLYGYSNHPDQYGDCASPPTGEIVARPGLQTIHIAVPSNCR